MGLSITSRPIHERSRSCRRDHSMDCRRPRPLDVDLVRTGGHPGIHSPRNCLEMSLRNGVERKWHWTQLHMAQLPHIRVMREPSSDQSDGNADPKFENEAARERGWRQMPDTKFPKDIQSSAPVGQRVPKSAYQSPKLKSLFAAISDSLFWGLGMRPCCYEKNTLYFAVTLLCSLLLSLIWNVGCQLLEIANVLKSQLLPLCLDIYTAQPFVLLNERVVKIWDYLK